MLTTLAAVAQLEREQTAERTRQALAPLRNRGVRLGRPVSEATRKAGPRAVELRAQGRTWRDVATQLEEEGHRTARGCATWHAASAQRAARSVELDEQAAERQAAA